MAAGWRNALAAIGVVAFLAALIVVPAGVDAVLPEDGPLPSGELDVGHGVSLRPPPGARLDLAASRPGTGEVLLLARRLRVAVTAVQVRERPADYVAHARRKLRRDGGFRVGEPVSVRTATGVPGERSDLLVGRGGHRGRPGCAGIFTGEKAGAVVVISPVEGCAAVPADVWKSVTSLTFSAVDTW